MFVNLKKYFAFEGRINRAKYFGISFLLGLIYLPFCIFCIIYQFLDNILVLLLFIGLSIIVGIVQICITVQRFHDIERPGTHYWLLLIPIYNIYLSFVLLFKKGTDGPNEYGEDPLSASYE